VTLQWFQSIQRLYGPLRLNITVPRGVERGGVGLSLLLPSEGRHRDNHRESAGDGLAGSFTDKTSPGGWNKFAESQSQTPQKFRLQRR